MKHPTEHNRYTLQKWVEAHLLSNLAKYVTRGTLAHSSHDAKVHYNKCILLNAALIINCFCYKQLETIHFDFLFPIIDESCVYLETHNTLFCWKRKKLRLSEIRSDTISKAIAAIRSNAKLLLLFPTSIPENVA